MELSTIDNTQATDKTFKPKTDFFHSFLEKKNNRIPTLDPTFSLILSMAFFTCTLTVLTEILFYLQSLEESDWNKDIAQK